MTSLTVPLSSICPCWKARLIPSAFEALKRGIELERERFRGKPFVVVAIRHEYDYDGLTEYVGLLEGFPAEEAAVEYARSRAEAARRATLGEPSYGDSPWRIVDEPWPARYAERPDRESIRCVFRERFKMATGSGYDSRYFEFEVLHMDSAEIIDAELFTYLGAEPEVTWYLIGRGKA